MNKIKGFIITLFALVSNMTFAANGAIAARTEMIAQFYQLVTVFGMAMGIGLMVLGGIKLKKRADNPNDAKSFPTAIIITLLAGALSFNYAGSAGLIINSFLGNDSGYCFVVQDGNYSENDGYSKNCWNPDNSDILQEVADKVDQMSNGTAGSKLKENARAIVALFQTIGLIYLLKGFYGLKLVAEGTAREGYGKPIITLIASALVIDLPHTLTMLQNTINALGFGV